MRTPKWLGTRSEWGELKYLLIGLALILVLFVGGGFLFGKATGYPERKQACEDHGGRLTYNNICVEEIKL